MKAFIPSFALALVAASIAHAQNLAVTRTSGELGFSFTVPADWQVLDTSATAKEQARQKTTNEEDKKGLACAEIGLTARHGNPPSVITEVSLPFDCYGQKMADADLPGLAASASAGLEQNFDLADPVYGGYALGTHRFWIERVKGAVKGQPDLKYTIEIACSVSKKAAVCWMTMASDYAALATFEHMPVSLDGDTAEGLVPVNAFAAKPS
ncbi:MAG TPA: hypothetical protein VGJ21_09810 [Terracidiphilus sp.]|jgi:hypothetical protein